MPNFLKVFNRGFSLIELMIVVAILGILAAVAVPAFTKFMNNSKTAEVPSNLDGIIKSEQAYYAANDTFLSLDVRPFNVVPCNVPNNIKCTNTIADFSSTVGVNNYRAIQFAPSGNVYAKYSGTACGLNLQLIEGTQLIAGWIAVQAVTNIDNDSGNATWTQPVGIASATGDIYVQSKIKKNDSTLPCVPAITTTDDF